jgi:hypothetical protein
MEELRANTLEGLRILEKHDLYVKESKCHWEVEEVPVLGHIIGHGQMQKSKPSWSGARLSQRTMSTSGTVSVISTTNILKVIPASPSH